MITIQNAGALAGYSGTDHLIDESEIKDVIGVQYRCVGDALRAVEKRCFNRGRHHPYVWADIRMANGDVHHHTSVH